MIPFVDLKAQYESLKTEIDSAMANVIESSSFIHGPQVAEFEEAFRDLLGVKCAIGVASGTDALHLAVRACDIGPGDEVITVPNTWISTAYAIAYVGAKPVFVDIDPDTYQMDVADLERKITPATKAVIPVHLFGHPAPMNHIVDICRPRGIRIIEDVAQSPLAKVDGQMTGGIGDVACFSFYPSKNLGCYGDGGAIIANNDEYAAKIRTLADYGQSGKHHHELIGFNSRLDTLQAAILLAKIENLEAWTRSRRDNAEVYNELLRGLPVKTPMEAQNCESVYHLYVIQTDDRDECLQFLRDRGVMAQVHYPNLIHLQPCFSDLGYGKGDFPVAESYVGRILSLPMYPELNRAQMETVAASLSEFHGG